MRRGTLPRPLSVHTRLRRCKPGNNRVCVVRNYFCEFGALPDCSRVAFLEDGVWDTMFRIAGDVRLDTGGGLSVLAGVVPTLLVSRH